MLWRLGKKPSQAPFPSQVFESGEAFFEMQCKFGSTDIVPEQGIVALVLDARKEFGTYDAIKISADGRQLAAVKVASPDGGFVVAATTPSGKGDRLKPDDVVIWVPSEFSKAAVGAAEDERVGRQGLIRAKLAPETDSNGDPKITCRYD